MLTFIPTPIGNPQDITIRALREFERATLFLCEDTRETKRLLKILEARFEFNMPEAIFLSFHEHNGKARLKEVASRLESEIVVYVSDAGMPIISDPGQILVEYCQKQNIKYDVLAGASAVTTAYASSGFEEGKFIFWGFLPHKGKARGDEVREILNSKYNTILYEAPHRLLKLITEITSLDEDRELFLAKELTKKFQKYYRGSAKELLEKLQASNIKGEWVVIVKADPKESKALYLNDILALDIPPKIKAKLLSKVSQKSIKECYSILTN